MITLELRRHSVKDGVGGYAIGPRGYDLARQVGVELRGRNFTHFFVSPLWRTQQTLAAMAEGAEDFDLQFGPFLFPPHVRATEHDGMALWGGVCKEAEQEGEDMYAAVRQVAPQVVLDIARDGGRLFREWAEALPHNASVLVIGHSPYLEMIVEDVTGIALRAFAPCEGATLAWDGRVWTLVRECRLRS